MELLIATGNKGKIAEIRDLLKDSGFVVRGLDDFESVTEVEETGNTFIENAILKAKGYALQTGALTLADDSGLEVDALGGRPGVLSARYGGEGTAYPEKIALLLNELDEAAKSGTVGRSARFKCVMALADSRGQVLHTSEGICEGSIAFASSGSNGFGYDPVFIPVDHDSTFGELSGEIKQGISHRALAIVEIIRFLQGFRGV